MAQSKVTIISNAVTIIGHKPISSLDDQDDLVVSAEQAYDLIVPAVLSNGNWRFAVQIQQLTKSVEVPPIGSPWTAIYLLPAGYLKNTRIYPQNYQYDIYENSKIYSSWSGDIWMEYQFVPDPSKFTASFSYYIVHEIAAYLCLSSAQKTDYYTVIENKRIQTLAISSASDAQNRPNSHQATFPVLNNREIGGIVSNING